MAEYLTLHHGNYEGQILGNDEKFAMEFVEEAGLQALTFREMAAASNKIDNTLVTTIDKANSMRFRRMVRAAYGPDARIHDEEAEKVRPADADIVWAVDPLDGTGQYGATFEHPVTGSPIRPGEPIPQDARLIDDARRSTSIGVVLFKQGVPQVAAVYAPYQNKLFVASEALGGAYLNGNRLDLSQMAVARQTYGPGITYDIASWPGSLTDPRHLRLELGRAPNGTYSAIMQGCEVAEGRSSTFAVFTGDTLHDIGPAAYILQKAGGVVTDLYGNDIDWNNLKGAIYAANPSLHQGAKAAINAPRLEGLPPGYTPVDKHNVTAQEILELRNRVHFGTEQRLEVWQDALEHTYAFVGARHIQTGRLVLASFLTGCARQGTMHDLVSEDRMIGLGAWAIAKRIQLAESYKAGGKTVGMAYVDVDLGIEGLGATAPLAQTYRLHKFKQNNGAWIRNYRHGT